MQWDITLDVCALVRLVVFCTYIFHEAVQNTIKQDVDVFCVVIFISILLDILLVVTVSIPDIFHGCHLYRQYAVSFGN